MADLRRYPKRLPTVSRDIPKGPLTPLSRPPPTRHASDQNPFDLARKLSRDGAINFRIPLTGIAHQDKTPTRKNAKDGANHMRFISLARDKKT